MTLSLIRRPLHFGALRDGTGDVWRRPRQFSFLDRLGAVPLSDSEILQTSLYLPLAVQEGAGTHEVVAVVHPDFLARPPLRADGRWGHSYMPIALRCLPFRSGGRTADGVAKLEMATDLADDDAVIVPFAENGRMRQDLARVVSLLDRLERGKASLASAAASLVAADLLVPLTSTDAENALAADVRLLVIDPRRLRKLTSARTAALAADSFLPLDLATAFAFSSRLWAPNLVPDRSKTDGDAQTPAMDAALFGQHVQASFAIELRIDDSSLFSFDAFAKGDKPAVESGC